MEVPPPGKIASSYRNLDLPTLFNIFSEMLRIFSIANGSHHCRWSRRHLEFGTEEVYCSDVAGSNPCYALCEMFRVVKKPLLKIESKSFSCTMRH